MMADKFSQITPQIEHYTKLCMSNGPIDPQLYQQYDVKRGLRDLDGKGVLTGLTEISDIVSKKQENGKMVPCEGKLYYRGVDVEEMVRGFVSEKRFGFEEATYLLLFGNLPNREQLDEFCGVLADYRTLPTSFVRDIIMKAPSQDMMNTLARSVLTLYSYDANANDTSIPNVLRQCLELISLFPLLSVYGYQAYSHYHDGKSLFIHSPKPELSTAENILRGADLRCGAGTACRARRRKQLHFYHPRRYLLWDGYLFRDRGGAWLAERPAARRCEHQGGADVRGHEAERKRLERRRRDF